MTIVLASASPRRRELLGLLGLPFEVRVPDVDESVRTGEDAATYVERLARAKANEVTRGDDDLVIAADTSVVLDGRIFGKPIDSADARSMLATLSGRSHEVMTAVAVAHGDYLTSAVDVSTVRFAALSDRDIEWYVATGEPLDKAGAYAVQGVGGLFVAAVDGNVQSVIGLPLALVRALARGAGVDLLPT
jgi:septum formation protein